MVGSAGLMTILVVRMVVDLQLVILKVNMMAKKK